MNVPRLSNEEKNAKVDLLIDLMLSETPEDKEKFKALLLEIVQDCRLFGSHLLAEVEEWKSNPTVICEADVRSSCKRFYRESISNLFGWGIRKISSLKEKYGKKEEEVVSEVNDLADALFPDEVLEGTVVEDNK